LSGDNDSEKNKLSSVFESEENLLFNMKPADKQSFVEVLISKGENVCMIGDGVNDSGALNASDFGISVADDIYQFTPASDAILNSGALQNLHKLKSFAESSVSTVKLAYIISFMYNFVGLTFAVQGLVSPLFAAILMPLSSVTVVAFTTGRTYWLSKNIF
jgi:Cu+-exporting ATPase